MSTTALDNHPIGNYQSTLPGIRSVIRGGSCLYNTAGGATLNARVAGRVDHHSMKNWFISVGALPQDPPL